MKKRNTAVIIAEALVLVILLALLAWIVVRGIQANDELNDPKVTVAPMAVPTPAPTPEPTPTPMGLPDFEPHSVEETRPNKLISSTAIMVDGELVEDYESEYEIMFDLPERYTELEGVIGFRGNNFRTGAAYGTADVSSKTISTLWTRNTSGLSDTDGS